LGQSKYINIQIEFDLQNIIFNLMSETNLEQLTTELSGILKNLNQILTNANQPQALIEAPNNNIIKKTSNMTYHEYLVQVLQSR